MEHTMLNDERFWDFEIYPDDNRKGCYSVRNRESISREVTLEELLELLKSEYTGFVNFLNGIQYDRRLENQLFELYYWSDDDIPHNETMRLRLRKEEINDLKTQLRYTQCIYNIGSTHIYNLFAKHITFINIFNPYHRINPGFYIGELIINSVDSPIDWKDMNMAYVDSLISFKKKKVVRRDISTPNRVIYGYRMDVQRTNRFTSVDSGNKVIEQAFEFLDILMLKEFEKYLTKNRISSNVNIELTHRDIYDEIISYSYIVHIGEKIEGVE